MQHNDRKFLILRVNWSSSAAQAPPACDVHLEACELDEHRLWSAQKASIALKSSRLLHWYQLNLRLGSVFYKRQNCLRTAFVALSVGIRLDYRMQETRNKERKLKTLFVESESSCKKLHKSYILASFENSHDKQRKNWAPNLFWINKCDKGLWWSILMKYSGKRFWRGILWSFPVRYLIKTEIETTKFGTFNATCPFW